MERLINRLQIKDFRLILAIQQSGQLALAAEQLSITQPAASRMLASIEKTVGKRLFDRHPKGMDATPVGAILARNAVDILRALESTEREVFSVGAGLAGTARVGSVTGGAIGFVVPAIQELKKVAKGSDIYLDVAPSDVLVEGLTNGEYDFVLSRFPAGTDTRLFSVRRGRVEIVHFLVREDHPLAKRKVLDLRELEGCEWVIQAPHTPMRKAVEEAFISDGVPLPAEIMNTTSLLVMIAYIASTDAISPVSREVAELLANSGSGKRLVALATRDPIIINPYHVISFKNRTMSPLAERLMALVLSKLSMIAPEGA